MTGVQALQNMLLPQTFAKNKNNKICNNNKKINKTVKSEKFTAYKIYSYRVLNANKTVVSEVSIIIILNMNTTSWISLLYNTTNCFRSSV